MLVAIDKSIALCHASVLFPLRIVVSKLKERHEIRFKRTDNMWRENDDASKLKSFRGDLYD